MLEKFNKFLWLSIAVCILFTIIGGMLIFFPTVSTEIIAYMVSFTLIMVGFILVMDYNSSILFLHFLPTGFLSIILGIIILLYPKSFLIIIPISVGIWMIMNSLANFQFSFSLIKSKYDQWFIPLLLSIITFLCGIIIIINPHTGMLALTTSFGIIMIIYSIIDLVNLTIFKVNVNSFVKELKK